MFKVTYSNICPYLSIYNKCLPHKNEITYKTFKTNKTARNLRKKSWNYSLFFSSLEKFGVILVLFLYKLEEFTREAI